MLFLLLCEVWDTSTGDHLCLENGILGANEREEKVAGVLVGDIFL